MKLYNTLSRRVEDVQALVPPDIGVYTCGPTVYDYAHVGHWFNYIRMDTLIRVLKLAKFQPKWIMNITDVGHLVSDADDGEDKLEKGAKREGKTAWQIAEFYTKDFLEGMQHINMLQPDEMPKATDHIPDQIALIKVLEEKGYTYIIDDGVYYDTSQFEKYADFAQLDLDEQKSSARITVNPQKKQPSDFALWKFSPANAKRDMEWDSPWGTGYPGWHIECSAMSMKYLGNTLDVHTGGIDHIPVHHTNEIAQSEAVTGEPFAKYWLHSNHVTVNGQKISKSLGNGIRLQDVVAKGIPPMAFRLHVLESHYRSQSRFSWDSLLASQNRLQRWYNAAVLRFQLLDASADSEATGDSVEVIYRSLTSAKQALLNDLESPQALAAIEDALNSVEQGVPAVAEQAFNELLAFIDQLLGLDLLKQPDITAALKELIAQRQQAREGKDWKQADALRAQLAKLDIEIRDAEHGQLWSRTT